MQNSSSTIGENSITTDIHITENPDPPKTLYDVVSGNSKTEVFIVFKTGDVDVKRISKDTVDWKHIYACKDAHVGAMEKLIGFPLTAEQADSWKFPDGHVSKAQGDAPFVIFRDAETNDPAVFLWLMYRDNDSMFVDDRFPLKCMILSMQGIKGYDAAAFRKENGCTPQECAVDMLIMGGKNLWRDGWQLELSPGASYAGMEHRPVSWMKFLRDRYFADTPMFCGSLRLMSATKKRVREIFSLAGCGPVPRTPVGAQHAAPLQNASTP